MVYCLIKLLAVCVCYLSLCSLFLLRSTSCVTLGLELLLFHIIIIIIITIIIIIIIIIIVVVVVAAFPLLQRLREPATTLRYTHIACLPSPFL
jgi:hypothetical protein